MDKHQQEKKLLEEQIQALKENINTEVRERQELEARLKHLEDASARSQEVEDCFTRVYYAPKLVQYDRMISKMNSLKEKLDTAK